MFAATLGAAYNRMNRVKGALKRFWARARGIGGRKRGRGGDEGEKGAKARGDGGGAPWRLIPLGGALVASVVVFAILMNCEYGAYVFPRLVSARCDRWLEDFGFLSTSAGVGFLVFLMLEVVTVILAQMWIDRQRDLAEREAQAAERRAEMTEIARMAEAAARSAEAAMRMVAVTEQARREDAERAERRELRLIELIESLKNGKDNGSE